MKYIARIRTDYGGKFGIPRQSGIVNSVGKIVFEPEFRDDNALLGIDRYSYLWLIWEFSENVRSKWSPTVRPPRLGGNVRMGVFATRSPFRPNPIGLSSVQLLSVEKDGANGTVLMVAGADLMDGTPIYDIKPYVPYADSHPDASGGFAPERDREIAVSCDEKLLGRLPEDKRAALLKVLAQDPRPAYHTAPERIYGLTYAGMNVRFRVSGDTLYVCDIDQTADPNR